MNPTVESKEFLKRLDSEQFRELFCEAMSNGSIQIDTMSMEEWDTKDLVAVDIYFDPKTEKFCTILVSDYNMWYCDLDGTKYDLSPVLRSYLTRIFADEYVNSLFINWGLISEDDTWEKGKRKLTKTQV